MRRRDASFEPPLAGGRLNLDKADGVTEPEHARERILRDPFDSRDRMRSIKSEDALPVIRRFERQLDLGTVFYARAGLRSQSLPSHSRSLLRAANFAWAQTGLA